MPLPLPRALDAVLDALPAEALRRATRTLIEVYRSGAPPSSPALHDAVSAAAYAGYRMPATHAAAARVLRGVRELAPDLAVTSLVDLGGGTGALAWAAADAWPGLASVDVLDASEHALALGRAIARYGPAPVAAARWTRTEITPATMVPRADLATIGYVLGELPKSLQHSLIDAAAASADIVVVLEPGTPRGFAAITATRTRLIDAGWHLVAPCPHTATCPLAAAKDWCHTSVRVDRTARHRRLKDAQRGHEDEKVSYVVATREPTGSPVQGRVLRRPRTRKGLVQLEVCRADGTAGHEMVTRRDPQRYRQARSLAWGDAVR